eukprot:TRINITY_DN2097_c1_g4_i1.p1 TRINITY_DN2097_c1_g4~~TRINITY_DN2097_c1_g4_i1.p1  ORF type:complete len:1807 (+),score=500.85 TRINITY_DN2097_c1_g4_i1:70-5421(+)
MDRHDGFLRSLDCHLAWSSGALTAHSLDDAGSPPAAAVYARGARPLRPLSASSAPPGHPARAHSALPAARPSTAGPRRALPRRIRVEAHPSCAVSLLDLRKAHLGTAHPAELSASRSEDPLKSVRLPQPKAAEAAAGQLVSRQRAKLRRARMERFVNAAREAYCKERRAGILLGANRRRTVYACWVALLLHSRRRHHRLLLEEAVGRACTELADDVERRILELQERDSAMVRRIVRSGEVLRRGRARSACVLEAASGRRLLLRRYALLWRLGLRRRRQRNLAEVLLTQTCMRHRMIRWLCLRRMLWQHRTARRMAVLLLRVTGKGALAARSVMWRTWAQRQRRHRQRVMCADVLSRTSAIIALRASYMQWMLWTNHSVQENRERRRAEILRRQSHAVHRRLRFRTLLAWRTRMRRRRRMHQLSESLRRNTEGHTRGIYLEKLRRFARISKRARDLARISDILAAGTSLGLRRRGWDALMSRVSKVRFLRGQGEALQAGTWRGVVRTRWTKLRMYAARRKRRRAAIERCGLLLRGTAQGIVQAYYGKFKAWLAAMRRRRRRRQQAEALARYTTLGLVLVYFRRWARWGSDAAARRRKHRQAGLLHVGSERALVRQCWHRWKSLRQRRRLQATREARVGALCAANEKVHMRQRWAKLAAAAEHASRRRRRERLMQLVSQGTAKGLRQAAWRRLLLHASTARRRRRGLNCADVLAAGAEKSALADVWRRLRLHARSAQIKRRNRARARVLADALSNSLRQHHWHVLAAYARRQRVRRLLRDRAEALARRSANAHRRQAFSSWCRSSRTTGAARQRKRGAAMLLCATGKSLQHTYLRKLRGHWERRRRRRRQAQQCEQLLLRSQARLCDLAMVRWRRLVESAAERRRKVRKADVLFSASRSPVLRRYWQRLLRFAREAGLRQRKVVSAALMLESNQRVARGNAIRRWYLWLHVRRQAERRRLRGAAADRLSTATESTQMRARWLALRRNAHERTRQRRRVRCSETLVLVNSRMLRRGAWWMLRLHLQHRRALRGLQSKEAELQAAEGRAAQLASELASAEAARDRQQRALAAQREAAVEQAAAKQEEHAGQLAAHRQQAQALLRQREADLVSAVQQERERLECAQRRLREDQERLGACQRELAAEQKRGAQLAQRLAEAAEHHAYELTVEQANRRSLIRDSVKQWRRRLAGVLEHSADRRVLAPRFACLLALARQMRPARQRARAAAERKARVLQGATERLVLAGFTRRWESLVARRRRRRRLVPLAELLSEHTKLGARQRCLRALQQRAARARALRRRERLAELSAAASVQRARRQRFGTFAALRRHRARARLRRRLALDLEQVTVRHTRWRCWVRLFMAARLSERATQGAKAVELRELRGQLGELESLRMELEQARERARAVDEELQAAGRERDEALQQLAAAQEGAERMRVEGEDMRMQIIGLQDDVARLKPAQKLPAWLACQVEEEERAARPLVQSEEARGLRFLQRWLRQKEKPFGKTGSLGLAANRGSSFDGQFVVIGKVSKGGPAEKAGLMVGDRVYKVATPRGLFPIPSVQAFMEHTGPAGHCFEGVSVTFFVGRIPRLQRRASQMRPAPLGMSSPRRSFNVGSGGVSGSPTAAAAGLAGSMSLGTSGGDPNEEIMLQIVVRTGPVTEAAKQNRVRNLRVTKGPTFGSSFDPVAAYDLANDPERCEAQLRSAFEEHNPGQGEMPMTSLPKAVQSIAARLGVPAPPQDRIEAAAFDADVDESGGLSFTEFFDYVRELFVTLIYSGDDGDSSDGSHGTNAD